MSQRAWDVLVQHLTLTILLCLTLQQHAAQSQDFNSMEDESENHYAKHYIQEFLEDVSQLSNSRLQEPVLNSSSAVDPYLITTYGEKCLWCGTDHRMKGESRKVKVKREEKFLMPGDCEIFSSPKQGKNDKYPNDIDCRWKYKTSDCSVITLNIPKGSIQKSSGCHRDKLSVKVGSKTIQKCAEFFNFVVDSGETSEMNIRFETNHRIRWWGYDGTICASKCATTTTTTTTTTTSTTTTTTTTTPTPISCDDVCGNRFGYSGPGSDADSRGERISSIADAAWRYPWVVVVDVMRDHVFVRCGGYLISKSHVITSAYCFYQETPIGVDGAVVRVTAGEYDLTSGEEDGPTSQIVYSSDVVEYPDYDYTIGTGVYNIALITIPNGGFTLNSRVCPVCMADSSMDVPTNLHVSAFGWTKYEFPAVNMSEIAVTKCSFPIGDDLLCILISGNTPCHGDDGSAIYANVTDGTYYAYGHVNAIITSKCPVTGFVLPCVRLSWYQDWIDSITGTRYCNN